MQSQIMEHNKMDPDYIKDIAYRRLRMYQRDTPITEEELALIDVEVEEVISLSQSEKDDMSNRVYGWFHQFYPEAFPSRMPTVVEEEI